MPISYKIYRDIELLYTVFDGKVDKGDALVYVKNIYNDKDIDFAKKTLVILRNSNLVFKIEDVEDFAKAVINNKRFNLRAKIALLIGNPTDAVAATIYAQTIVAYRKLVQIQLFYTLSAACNFLDLPSDNGIIEDIIQENVSIIGKS